MANNKVVECDVCGQEIGLFSPISREEGRCRKCRELHLVPGQKPRNRSIKFRNDFDAVLLSGQKVKTSRTSKAGEVGDNFRWAGWSFEITSVEKMELGRVATEFFKEEGFESPEAFITAWGELHPRKGYDSHAEVWVHTFKKVKEC